MALFFFKVHFLAFSKVYFLFFCWSFPFIILSRAGVLESYCVNLFLCCHTLVSSSMVIVNFAGHNSLVLQMCSLKFCMISGQDILAFIVCGEKAGVILIVLPLYVTWPLSLTTFDIICLVPLVFLLRDGRNFFPGPIYLETCRLILYSWTSFSFG